MSSDLRVTWQKSLLSLMIPILIILAIRWALFEPYIIPSGSMLPNLLIHDHVLVNKFAYGIRLPFSKQYLFQWSQVKRGDIIVFRYPKDPDIFYVKRVLGLPGEKIRWQGHKVWINDQPVKQKETGPNRFLEERWLLEYQDGGYAEDGEYEIGKDEVFVMGDHRDNSSDSRVWGGVQMDLILGRVSRIWMSCNKMLDPSIRLCDPTSIRWERLGLKP
jgi:signal peptidase I